MAELTLAQRAAYHIIRRVQSDASFAWVMLGTESLALCTRAVAECQNEEEDQVRERIEKNAASLRETPEIVRLRAEVEKLRGEVEKNRNENIPVSAVIEAGSGVYRSLNAIDDLMRIAECDGTGVVNVDALRTAIYDPTALAIH